MAEEGYQRRFGDRREGRLVRTLSPADRLAPYIQPLRGEAARMFADAASTAGSEAWLREKRQEGWAGMGMMHLFLAAYVRAAAEWPGVNRFVSGQKIYTRHGVEAVLLVRRSASKDAGMVALKLALEPSDTVFDVYRRMRERVDAINAGEYGNYFEERAEGLLNLPSPVLKFVLWCMRCLDYFGWLPRSFLESSPYHGSVMLAALESPGPAPGWNALGEFGNLPLFISIGEPRASAPGQDGAVEYTLTVDTRAVDSAAFAGAMKAMRYYIENPAALELPPQTVKEDAF